MDEIQQKVRETFHKRFGESPAYVVRAPGRVNLIGEHTDYNDGYVLPMAIDRANWIALRGRGDGRVSAFSLDFNHGFSFMLDGVTKGEPGWVEYIKGVAWALQEAGLTLNAWEGILAGDIPIAAGLSSSAALEMATARAFAAVSGWEWDAARMARAGQKAENEWVGVNCGIMDQMISAAGVADHALLIDCRSLATEAVPLPPQTAVVVLDTGTRRGLVDSAYNERRAQCEAAAKFFGVPALRDVTLADLLEKGDGLDPVTRKRAHHIITENDRVLHTVESMKRGDAVEMGQYMIYSHDSLRDQFEVSSDALNAMVTCALRDPSCYGARMTGGGFGGCAVALVRAEAAEKFASVTAAAYQTETGNTPQVYVCRATDGASLV